MSIRALAFTLLLVMPIRLMAEPTTQEILNAPTTAPSFEAASRAAERFVPAAGLKIATWAAEPQVGNPACLWPDDRGRMWVVETFRFDAGGPGEGVYDIRHMYDRLDDDLSSKTVERRLELLKKWNKDDLSSVSQWPDRVRLLEDTKAAGRCDSSKIFDDRYKDPLDGVAAGILVRGDDVYFADIPNLWLLRDTDHDGRADFRQSLSYGYGVHYSLLGHDLHGLRFGPDGKLYFSVGDRGLHVTTKEGKVLDNPDSGAVLRCDPDGANLELFATGLRNPQELAFDEFGNLFTGDNNCDHGDPARWVYIVEGGDSGWRIGYQHIKTPKPTGPWLAEHLSDLEGPNTPGYIIPPVAHIGTGPSGVAYYPGTGLGPQWNQHFFEADFRAGPLSLVHSFALRAKGARFEAYDVKPFVDHIVATDVDFGPDGAAYIADWNAGWVKYGEGRIYKVYSPEAAADPIVKEVKTLLADGMSNRKSEELAILLAHRDMRIRQRAQFELAKRGPDSIPLLSNVIRDNTATLPRIHAMWAIGQIARAQPHAIDLITPLLDDKDDEVRAQALKLTGEARNAAAIESVIRLMDDPSPRVRFFAAMCAGKLGKREAAPALVKLLARNADEDAFIRHGAVFALSAIGDKSLLIASAHDPNRSIRMGVLLALRRLQSPEVTAFLDDPDPALVIEAARAINDVPIEPAFPQLAALATNPNHSNAVLHRALNAAFRLGKPDNAAAVASIAAAENASELMRIEALSMLADWTKPRGVDRVLGIWRPLPERDPSIAKDAARPILASLLASAPDPIRREAITLIRKLGVVDQDLLFNVVTAKNTPPQVAADALLTMETISDPKLDAAVEASLKAGKGMLRAQAIRIIARKPDPVARLESFLTSGSISDQQSVLGALATLDDPAVGPMISRWMDKLIAGDVVPELQLDLLEAAEHCKSDAIKDKLKQFESARSKDDKLASYREAIAGGDADAGRKIFFEKAETSCYRCHKINGEGGLAGPDLSTVGSRRDRAFILESIINPNAAIAPGFESVTVKVKAEKRYTGLVTAEDDAKIILDAGDGATIHIDKKEMASRTKGLSPMPQDVAKPLNKRDLRDLVEYLATCRQPQTAERH